MKVCYKSYDEEDFLIHIFGCERRLQQIAVVEKNDIKLLDVKENNMSSFSLGKKTR